MKEIPLTQNQVALVDDTDFEWLSQWKWLAVWNRCTRSFYARRKESLPCGKRVPVQMQRVILGLKRGDKLQADHKNHDTLDNRRENLRAVTCAENQWNRHANGYTWDKRRGKYKAKIEVGGVQKFLGYFDTSDEARAAYLKAKTIYHRIKQRPAVTLTVESNSSSA